MSSLLQRVEEKVKAKLLDELVDYFYICHDGRIRWGFPDDYPVSDEIADELMRLYYPTLRDFRR